MVRTQTVWVSKLPEFAAAVGKKEKEIFDGIVDLMYESIVEGSTVTGSPGQPADLRDGDWVKPYDSDLSASISISENSARSVEDGFSYKHGRRLTKLHSEIGGFNSVALTVAGYEKIALTVATQAGKVDA